MKVILKVIYSFGIHNLSIPIRFSMKNEIIQILQRSTVSFFHNCTDISIEDVHSQMWWRTPKIAPSSSELSLKVLKVKLPENTLLNDSLV